MGASAGIYRWGYAGKRFVSRLRDARRYNIHPEGLVLDVGSGQDPHPRANILCDRYVADSTERACGGGLLIDRPLVLADATATPFPNNAFDFVYCSHLLEHMDDPASLLKELQRIGKAGYIETPSKIYEKLWGWDFHKWFVSVENGTLVLEAKPQVVFDDDLHKWWGHQIEREDVWRFVIPRLRELGLLSIFVWTDEIPFEVRGQGAADAGFQRAQEGFQHTLEALREVSVPRLRRTQRIKGVISRWHRRRSDPRVAELLDRLVCPKCGTELVHDDRRWGCHGCGRNYRTVDGIPIMLPDGPDEPDALPSETSTITS